MNRHSIRGLLLGGTLAMLLGVMGAAAWIGFDAGEDEASELFDARLATSARVLAALVGERPLAGGTAVLDVPDPVAGAPHDAPSPLGHPYETKIAFQLLDAAGRIAMRSSSAPAAAFAPLEPGFHTVGLPGHEWRVFVLRSAGGWVQVAERDDVRAEIAWKLALATVGPLLVGIPLLAALLAGLVRYGLGPLSELARGIERRAPGSLVPVQLRRTPAEVAPVVAALNGFLEGVRAAMARERRFTADAAHELRTPLAALKVHAQNAARADRPEEREASLARMLAGLERSIRLVEQMLAYSRAAAAVGAPAPEPVSLQVVVEDALEDVVPRVRERGLRFRLTSEPPEDIAVPGDRQKLVALVRNLLDNAARYAPQGSTIAIELRQAPGTTSLAVVDSGTGIPPELRERVFESYFRIPGSPGDGSGLGLAIVREIAGQHGAVVRIDAGDGGLGTRVTVDFHT